MTLAKIIKLKDAIRNIFDHESKLVYIVESRDWSIRADGKEITSVLNSRKLLKGRIALTFFGLKNRIIHFGSINAFLGVGFNRLDLANKNVVTWFHVVPDDQRLKYIPYLNEKIDSLVTSCQITKKVLVKNGLREDKIVVIPIGVDLKSYRVLPAEKRAEMKKKLGLSENRLIIGSFQKDGNGWGEGLEPKLIKGPDIFCEVIERLAKNHKIEVLLTGPARGYVKKRLAAAGVPYKHVYYRTAAEASDLYNCLDLYIVASRVEGGPKAVVESWAAGVPLVSTRMGMAADIVKDGQNGLLADIEDVNGLAAAAEKIIADKSLREKLAAQALLDVKNYSWEKLALDYYEQVYKKLLS